MSEWNSFPDRDIPEDPLPQSEAGGLVPTGSPDPHVDADLVANHDPEGVEMATQVAHSFQTQLPPPRGVNPTPRRPRRKVVDETRSGAHPDERDPKPIGKALGRLIADRGWTTQVNLHMMLTRWADLVGEANAEHCQPEGFRDGVLTVRADSTTWATSLRLIAPSLVARLNDQLGQGSVTRVEIKGPAAPSWKHGRRSVRDGRGPRDTYG